MKTTEQKGIALVSVLLLMALLMTLLAGYYALSVIELSTTGSSMNATRGFYAAEAGLNIRAGSIRQTFLGYNRPAGTSPDAGAGPVCDGANDGAGDYRCLTYALRDRSVDTYVVEPAGNPSFIRIPRGEAYQNLNAQEYAYRVFSEARGPSGRTEALLEMHFKSRLVPLFQFAAFYNKDLEILPGPNMMLEGPVHSNGDLYLGSNNSLDILGQITTAGDLYHGRKNDDSCMPGAVRAPDPDTLTLLPDCGSGRKRISQAETLPFNGMIRIGLEPVTVPEPESIDAEPGRIYWDRADFRVVLDLNGATPAVEVRDATGAIDGSGTAMLAACGAAVYSDTFYNNREGAFIDMLDVDLRGLLDCVHANPLMEVGKGLDDSSEGGLVLYLGVDGPDMDGFNAYGVRVSNGAEIAATSAFAPEVRGLTVVSNQAAYILGDYNSVEKKPAAVMADSVNVLSNAWSDTTSTLALSQRRAADTVIHAAFLAGTDLTGGAEGADGQDSGEYNGGLENYPRFHENWSGRLLTYRGSFVSLNAPRHVDGAWAYGGSQYTAPTRDWRYDTDFDDATGLPPLSPRFVYLRQELFVRKFDL